MLENWKVINRRIIARTKKSGGDLEVALVTCHRVFWIVQQQPLINERVSRFVVHQSHIKLRHSTDAKQQIIKLMKIEANAEGGHAKSK